MAIEHFHNYGASQRLWRFRELGGHQGQARCTRTEQLTTLLRQYKPRNGNEARDLQATRNQLGVRRPFDVANVKPGHVTASGYVLSPDRKEMLIIYHQKLGRWMQPGGHVDPGETVLQAAMREIGEETGLDPKTLLARKGVFQINVFNRLRDQQWPSHKEFDVRFLFVATTKALRHAPETTVRWVPLNMIKRYCREPALHNVLNELRRVKSRGHNGWLRT